MPGLKKYPFFDGKKWKDEGLGLIKNYIIYKGIERYKPKGKERNTKFKKLLCEALDATEEKHRQEFIEKRQSIFPKVAAWQRYSQGASIVDKLYTVEMFGKEIPVYMTKKTDVAPTDEILSERVKEVRDTKKSHYNEQTATLEFYNDGFSIIAADKYTRGDYRRLEDPKEFSKWFVRDDTWLMQQYGGRSTDDERVIELDGEQFKVNVYSRPDKVDTWLYWAVGDKIYDMIDAPFDLVQERIEKEMPPHARQIMLKREYRTITGVTRALFGRKAPELDYDCTDDYENVASADDYPEEEPIKKAA